MDLINKIESLRYDIENGNETDVISISVRLIQIKDQALLLLQPQPQPVAIISVCGVKSGFCPYEGSHKNCLYNGHCLNKQTVL
jgi:hypothetical protein